MTDLVHRGMIRRVYGSFFYSGPTDVGYEPSRRLVRHVTAEVERIGNSLPLRILAAAEQAVPASHLVTACAGFGVELAPGWDGTFTSSGWLSKAESVWGEGLAFTCPAYRQALFETIRAECSSTAWSRGVELVRAAAVTGERDDGDEVVLRVSTRGGMVSPSPALPTARRCSRRSAKTRSRACARPSARRWCPTRRRRTSTGRPTS